MILCQRQDVSIHLLRPSQRYPPLYAATVVTDWGRAVCPFGRGPRFSALLSWRPERLTAGCAGAATPGSGAGAADSSGAEASGARPPRPTDLESVAVLLLLSAGVALLATAGAGVGAAVLEDELGDSGWAFGAAEELPAAGAGAGAEAGAGAGAGAGAWDDVAGDDAAGGAAGGFAECVVLGSADSAMGIVDTPTPLPFALGVAGTTDSAWLGFMAWPLQMICGSAMMVMTVLSGGAAYEGGWHSFLDIRG